ncbi:Pls/PosA family non-ribosomal peptide synthetase [Actinoallomurus acaciae]|uniref:Pls/PosA family non-ribosomal peptide synthetase n=1 Tax=Actinoallomurus acaciae TaxID=502577 RepID=A0ABV5YJP7_9ACTN
MREAGRTPSGVPPATWRPGHVLAGAGYDSATRGRDGERLEQLFEDRCDRLRESGHRDQLAVDAGDVVLTYDELDARANRLARYLKARGARPGDRIGLLFDRPAHSYAGLLAVLKMNAAYVPLDVGFPPDRLSYIVREAGVRLVLSLSHLRERLQRAEATVVCLDEVAALIAATDDRRLTDAEKGESADELCYIIYTSGSSGLPKGVAIRHSGICNFVRVAAEVYGVTAQDRVYQGMTIAFDFSVEEIWVPLAAGATLVPRPETNALIGAELWEFLHENDVTALCCVPTLLATIGDDLPRLRFLLVSGEPCPQELIARWHRPGRRFLNVYGPTEATVTATWTEVHPRRPVTIGVPLPTYAVVILDPGDDSALPPGEIGEIGIAGVGLATGYLNRADLTNRAFIRDFLGIEDNPSGRIYRTGDLGRVNDDGEIEYHGRIDTQVKIRGYRVEPAEIESILWRLPGIAHAVVDTFEPEPGIVELVAYYSSRDGGAGSGRTVDRADVHEHLRDRLPGYMVPAYLEELEAFPMLPSGKVDRARLPRPKGPRGVTAGRGYVAPETGTEQVLADALTGVMNLEQVSVDSHFFDDLGAGSLLMARFCARVRERPDLPSVSMRDVYENPTIRSLASILAAAAPRSANRPTPVRAAPARTSAYVLCGVLQLLLSAAAVFLSANVLVTGLAWASAGSGVIHLYERFVVFGSVTFLYLCAVPVLAKWVLVGRWTAREIRVWSLAYVRFWAVKTLIRSSPMALFAGSPLYVLYLRMLGAKIGRGVVIFAKAPVCTDLITVGDGTLIRANSAVTGYRVVGGVIQTGPITLGKNVFVGERTVLDINTAMGDGARLGHASSLHATQAVPAGERWVGSPARRADADHLTVPPARCGTRRRFTYGAVQLVNLLFVFEPLGAGIGAVLLTRPPRPVRLIEVGSTAAGGAAFFSTALTASAVLFGGAVLGGLIAAFTLPRLVHLVIRPGKVYPLYGFHYGLQRAVARWTNLKFFHRLFGDSSYVVHYLRALGYRFSRPIVQTGTNFGSELHHQSPFLTTIGAGTMVSDSLWIMNADFSSTSFRVSRVSIGAHSYLGNNIAYPAGARVGDNVLLGTKVAVPVDGELRENVGLLGSPCFEIPRSVRIDRGVDLPKDPDELRRRLAAKNRYNAVSMGLFLLVRWFEFFALTIVAAATEEARSGLAATMIVVGLLFTLLFRIGLGVLVERAVTRFHPLEPRVCSISDPYFWFIERLWKLLTPMKVLNGTPFKGVIWRLLGVRIGRRVFDDGCSMPDRTLVTIGDDCALGAGSVIQCHSLEEGVFKSDRTTIGAGCTLGAEAFVHYGVTMGDGAVLDADSFLMKGEEVPPHARWRGNPAREREPSPPMVRPGHR